MAPRGWALYPDAAGAVHVVPVHGDAPRIAGNHTVAIDCRACQPKAMREGPLDTPVWAHRQSDWPGALPFRSD